MIQRYIETGALDRPCPQCRAKIGQRCRNYAGTPMAPHAKRCREPAEAPAPRPTVTPPAANLFTEATEE